MQLKDFCNKEFWRVFVITIGAISSIVTLISFVFDPGNLSPWAIVIYGILIIIVAAGITYALTHKKKSLKLPISNNLTIKVESGDLFDYAKEKNFVVIPVNEYFDTVVDNKIVSSTTLHGLFINKFFKYNHLQLHEEIEQYLKNNKVDNEEVDKRPNIGGYTNKYPLGTCVPIEKGQVTYILLALTHFDEQDHAFVELSEFGRCISSLCKFLSNTAGEKPVYMPLMGMGMSRLNQPGQFILKYTLDTIVGIKDLAIPGGLNIIVYPPVARTLNLNNISY